MRNNYSIKKVTHFSFQLIDVIRVLWLGSWLCIKTLLLVLGEERTRRFGLHYMAPLVFVTLIGKKFRMDNLSLISKAFGCERIRWRLFSADPFIMSKAHELNITELILKARDLRNFIDVGAHIGRYSLLASRNSSCRVLAIEPDEKNFRLLAENLRLNGRENVQAIKGAVGSYDGYALLFLGNHSASHGVNHSSKHKVSAGRPVKMYTLRSLMDAFGFHLVDLVKVDVEGYEFSIVYSSEEITDRIVRWIVEVHDPERRDEMETFFRRKSYDTRWLDDDHLFAIRKRRPS